MFSQPFVILDLETTGVMPDKDQILEVACIRYENGKEVDRLEAVIRVLLPLPDIITFITGITDEEVKKNGVPLDSVQDKLEEILSGAYIIGHNIQFDIGFLKSSGIDLKTIGDIDTIPLAQILYPEATSYSLESLSTDFEIEHGKSHRAMGDVEATLELFKHLWKKASKLPKNLIHHIQDLIPKSEWDGAIFFEELKASSKTSSKVPGAITLETSAGIKRALDIQEFFGEKGALIKHWENYEPRKQQLEMAQSVMTAFQEEYHLICEAPTGIGKSLAYLVAAANMAIENKTKVVISTNTINLQEQLYEKDVPLLQSIYKKETSNSGIRVAVLKGRSHYLCLRRLAEFKRRTHFTDVEMILLVKILIWQETSPTGDCGEIHLTRKENLVWNFELSADDQHCTPQKCRSYGKCYLEQAREKAENADIIIVNHALLCADLNREGGLLPEYNYLIVDEAHHFEHVATEAFGWEVKQESLIIPIRVIKNHFEDLERRFTGTLFVKGKAFESIPTILEEIPDILSVIDNFFTITALFVNRNVPESAYIENLLIDKVLGASEEWINLGESLSEVNEKIQKWLNQLRKLATALEIEGDEEFPEQEAFLDELLQEILMLNEQFGRLNTFFEDADTHETSIRWITSDFNGNISIRMAPLMLGEPLKEKLYDAKKSIILTSATLGVQLKSQSGEESQHPFTYVRNMLGLNESFEELILDSPFDYEKQVYVITPNNLHYITNPKSIEQVSRFMGELTQKVGGSTMGLFTSYSALEKVYMYLMKKWGSSNPKILAQRVSGGRAKIMKAYLKDPKNSVLLGTSSFWEGVDISGDALTTLVIHKIPFDVPNDPVIKARSELFTNSFFQYTVPRAILKFRQGFGRLIRSTKDYGVMVILDNRMINKEYGKMFLESLPEGITIEQMPVEETPEKVQTWLSMWNK